MMDWMLDGISVVDREDCVDEIDEWKRSTGDSERECQRGFLAERSNGVEDLRIMY